MSHDPPSPNLDHATEARDDAVIGTALRWSLVVIGVVLSAAAGVAYWLSRPELPRHVREPVVELPEVRQPPQAQLPTIPFVNVTQSAGIDFRHENGAYGDKLLPETMGGGCAFFDYDSDGDQDLLLVNSRRWPWDPRPPAEQPTMCLYRNDGGGRFDDVTSAVGLDVSFYGMGAAVGDYDNDGDRDLFISAVGSNHLFRNDGGRFVDVSDEAGVAGAEDAWSTSCGFIDYDNDGRLDLFVGNYVRWSQAIDLGQGFQLVGVGRAYGPPTAFEGSYPYLYRNEGEGRFTDVSEAAGIQVRNPATGVPMAKTLGIAPVDLDRDGWMDLIIANDTVQNFLFHNQHDTTFQEVGGLAGIAFDVAGNARGAMGIDTAYHRNNETLSVGIGNFSNEMTGFYCATDSPLQFVDNAMAIGIGPATRLQLTFGLFFCDFDLDGRLDLLAANGHLEEEINKVQESQFYEQAPQLFWNCGPQSRTEFMPLSAENTGPDFHDRIVGRGAAYADIDGDGDLDVLITTAGRTPRLLRNDQQLNHHWLRLELIGTDCNRDAIGARVEVTVDGQVFQRQVMPTRSYLSQCELPLTIGLGNHTDVEVIRVIWPAGSVQEVAVEQQNTTMRIEEK